MSDRPAREGKGEGEGGEPLLRLEGGRISYGGPVVLREVDLAIGEGDRLGLVGANGSGKTTLLRALLGQLPLDGGRLVRRGDLRGVGYVPQRHALSPYFPLRARDVVVMGRAGLIGLGRRPGAPDWERVDEALGRVGLAARGDHAFADLSGGQQQRVLIARALATESKLLLLDEPTNGMDLVAEHEIMALVDRLNEEEGITVVLVSHVLSLVSGHCPRIAFLERGRLRAGAREDMLAEESLEALYGVPVRVRHDEDGFRVFLREGGDA